jgi:glycerol kinase
VILAVDQGTTGTTCLVVDDGLRPVGRGYCEIAQYFPEPGWVEHDPEEIWSSVLFAAEAALADAGIEARELAAVAIANQRETTEGAVLVGGAALQWLRDGLGVIGSAAESERLAEEVESTDGVFFVPALTGLGSPRWDADARGLICGLTRGTTRAHLARAALEAIAHQVADVLDVLPVEADVLRADGGATANRFLMQFQADPIGSPVEVAADAEATALGVAALAGLALGVWPDVEALRALVHRGARYEPAMSVSERARNRERWQRALRRAMASS